MSEYTFELKTVSEANQREHWRKKYQRKLDQQFYFRARWRYLKGTVTLPATITFTRFSCKTLDADNLAGAFKHVQDALAKEIGIDDGDGRITWKYEQERISTREIYFTVTVEK